MNSKKRIQKKVYDNSLTTLLFYIGTILFSLTMYRFIWPMETLSRIVNSSLLVFGVFYFIINFNRNNNYYALRNNFILPTLFIVVGMTLNILISASSDIKVLSSLGSVLNWVILLMLPDIYQKRQIDVIRLWRYSYYFMLVSVSLGLFDYVFIFVFGGDAPMIKSPYGVFLVGKFSLLHMLSDGTAHHRFYSCFAEPGSLAMILLPFIAYAVYKQKYVGLIILLTGFVLTNSLGGYISGLIMLIIMSYFSLKKNKIILILVFTISSFSLYAKIENHFLKEYEARSQNTGYSYDSSAGVRNQNFVKGVLKLPHLIFNKPLGIKLAGTTSENVKNENYIGSNFIPINYLQTGGLLAFIGYLIILYTSIKTALNIFMKFNDVSVEYKVVALSLIAFIPVLVQRTTIWETAWFALLYSPIIICNLTKTPKHKV